MPAPQIQNPLVSVIIPSRDGHRAGKVGELLASLEGQQFRDFDIHLVKGVFPQGRAINQGVRDASGEILLILDDDSRLADEYILQRMLDTLRSDPQIGMVGASIQCPPEASRFQKVAARQFPRFDMGAVDKITDSDYPCHGCTLIPRTVLLEVGGEREDIVRGLDPDLRERLRSAGYRVVLAPNCVAYHPLPDGWSSLLRIFFRNGYGSAYARKYRPDSVIETHESAEIAGFRPRRSFLYRVARYPLRLLNAAARGQAIRLAAYGSYACGYVWGMAVAKEDAIARG